MYPKQVFVRNSHVVTALCRLFQEMFNIRPKFIIVIMCLKRHMILRCFDTVFQRPYRYFSIALKVFFSLSDRYKIFTSNWLWIEICENVVLSKIDITMTAMNKKL